MPDFWLSCGYRLLARALRALAAVNPDALTPREALDALYRLKGLLKDAS